MNRAALAFLVAIATLPLAAPSQAQAPVTEQTVLANCVLQMGYTDAECACLMATARPNLTQRQIDYFVARVTRNEAEIQRMNTFVGLFERLAILREFRQAAELCAPGKPFVLPDL
jgi:hypothetical protein